MPRQVRTDPFFHQCASNHRKPEGIEREECIAKHPPLAPKDKNVQKRGTRKGYLNQEPKDTTQNAGKRSVWLATLANPERRRGIVPAHDTGRKMVKTPPPSQDL
jgi:hypothetical protein